MVNNSKLDKFVEDFRAFLEEEFGDNEHNPQLGVLGLVAEVRFFPEEGIGDSTFVTYCSDARTWIKEKVFEKGHEVVSEQFFEINFDNDDE